MRKSKLKFNLFLILCLFIPVVGFAQTSKKLDLSLKEKTLREFFQTIESKTEYSFMYNNIDLDQTVNIDVKQTSLENILKTVLTPKSLTYEVRSRQILIKKTQSIPLQNQLTRTITGTVADEYGEPIIGANVVEKGTTNGVITDIDGKFTLSVKEKAALQISYMGYINQNITVGNESTVYIILKEDLQALDEVVVVGYGTKRKGDITSAISVIDLDNIGSAAIVDASRMLVGQAAGVVVKQTAGTPGKEMEITVRGLGSLGASSAPLYVVDGFPVGTTLQQSLNPNDIESISILKDAASTSIYGARGSNGVILITTKGAKSGELRLTADVNFGVQNIPDNRRMKMMNGEEFAQFKKESFIDKYIMSHGKEPSIDEIPIDYRYPEQTQHSTDWVDEILNSNAIVQSYNITMAEGQGKVKSVFSLGYTKQEGALKKTNFERFNARANITGDFNKYITVGWNLAASRSNERFVSTEGRDEVIGYAMMVDPREPIYNEDGTWNDYIGGHDGIYGFYNPVMYLHEMKNKQNINRVTTNGYIEISFLKDFKFKPSVNASLVNLRRNDFKPSTIAAAMAPPPRDAVMQEWRQETVNYNADMVLTYAKAIEDHTFDVMLGYTAQEETFKQLYANGSKFPNDDIRIFQNAESVSANTAEYSWSLLAYLARVNYSYKNKYLFTASMRREGSSRFGADNKWGNFPSVSLGWKLSEEKFMQGFTWMSNLKLRGSYGVTGNNGIGNYSSLSGLSASNYILGGSFAPGVVLGSYANSRLGWERSNSLDLGFDLGLFKNKLAFTFEFYNKETDNMLLAKDIPIITGFSSTYTNAGKVRNRGVEMALDYKTKMTNDFNLRSNFNISFNRNKVLAITGENDYMENLNFYGYYFRSVVGKPMSMFYGYKCLGIFQSEEEIANSPKQDGAIPGVYKYWDANGDGEITYDTQDMVEIGNPHPKFTWAFTIAGDYKNFDFNILFTGAQNYDLNRQIQGTYGNLDGVFNVAAAAKDRFRSTENPGKGLYPTTNTWKWERETSSMYIYDASHAWLKSVSIGYTIPRNSSILKGARFYINAENLLLITNYPGFNPDINNGGGIYPGLDNEAYPIPMTFTLGTSITF